MKRKTNAKEKLINFLSAPDHVGVPITREEVSKKTGISKSRLSELINSLRSDGYSISTPNRSGLIILEPGQQLADCSFTSRNVRQWLILFVLSKKNNATYVELIGGILSLVDSFYETMDLEDNYSDTDIIKYLKEADTSLFDDINQFLPLPTLRKDLFELCEEGIVEKKRLHHKDGFHFVYSLTEKSPRVLFEPEDELYEFINYFDSFKDSYIGTPLQSIYKKITKIYDWEAYNMSKQIYGRINQIDQKQLDALNLLLSHPYKTKCLNVDYRKDNNLISISVCPGIIFYSIETSCFYLLCIDREDNTVRQLRLDKIQSITDTDEKNSSYRSQKFQDIYEEMFSSAYSHELTHVKILFQDFGNIRERIEALHKKRKKAKLYSLETPIKGLPHTIVYEDDIRGLSAFARYIRSFGSSALVVEPPNLRDSLINSYKKIKHNYEGDNR